MSNDVTFKFSDEENVVGFSSSKVDRDNCTIRGVTLITGGVQADGHDLFVDDTTVSQLHALAVKRGKVPVTLEHTGGIKDVNGYVENFSIQGNKLKGDWVLLQNHDETPVMLERAEKQPETFGLSVAFKGKGEKVNGKKCARAERLLSADCVKRQAANPDGLFSAETNLSVDSRMKNMADNIQHQQGEASISDVMNLLQNINQRMDAFEAVQSQLVDHINQSVVEPSDSTDLLEALYNATDEELAAFNQENGTDFTRADIESAVAEHNASIEGEGGEGGDGGEGDLAGVGDAGGATGQALSALAREVIQLKSKARAEELAALAHAEEVEFSELKSNIATLVEQRDRLIALSERVIAENEALRMAGVRGGRPAGSAAEVEFTERKDGGNVIEFETVVNAEYQRLVAAGASDIAARSKAIDFGVKRHNVAYQLWRKRGNPEIEFSAK